MASTIYSYNLTGGRVFPVAFEYLARRFVRVTLVGSSRRELQLNVDYRFISKTEIETTIVWAPGEFQTIEVRRVTSATDRLVNFTDGSILRSQDLNISQIQAIHIAEEGRDVAENSMLGTGLNWDALGLPIKNVGYPSGPNDAASVAYVKDSNEYTLRCPDKTRELPSSLGRANKIMGFDSLGNPAMVQPISSGEFGYKRKDPHSVADTVQKMIDVNPVSVWEFAEYAGGYNPETSYLSWDWRPAIQAALDYCQASRRRTLSIYGTLNVSIDPTSPAVPNAYTAGSVALSIKSPITIIGEGVVRLKDGQGKTDGAIFGNPHVTSIRGKVEINIEIDGNAANTVGTVSGILLVGVQQPVGKPELYIHDVTRHGFMCRPGPTQVGMTDTSFIVDGSVVKRCGGIGIQGTRVLEFIARDVIVHDTVDNNIDVYGNDPSGGLSDGFVGKALIYGAILDKGPTGIFAESFSHIEIRLFHIKNSNGIKLNRINSGALDCNIQNGKIEGRDDLTSSYGVSINNSSGYTSISGVYFDKFECSVLSNSGTDRLLMGVGNTHRRIRKYIVGHSTRANQLVKSTIKDQYIFEEGLTSEGYPQLTPPVSNPKYAASQYKVGRGTLRSIAGDVDLGVDFEKSKSALTTPTAWGGKYSFFNSGGDGETRINTEPDIAMPAYITCNGAAYYLVASGTPGEYYARLWDGTSAVKGDYRETVVGALDGPHRVSVKYPAFSNPAP